MGPAVLLACFSGLAAVSDWTVFSGGALLDPAGGTVVSPSLVVVGAETIQYCGPYRKDAVPENARIIDVRGSTILPGLVDFHGHVSSPDSARRMLASGVTVVRELGSPPSHLLSLIDEIQKGGLPGPTILAWAPVFGRGGPPFAWKIESVKQMRKVVRTAKEKGYGGIKVFDLSAKWLPRLVVESHQSGLQVAAHIDRLASEEVIFAGVDSIEHLMFLFARPQSVRNPKQEGVSPVEQWAQLDAGAEILQSRARALTSRGTVIVPTLAVAEAALWPERIETLHPEYAQLPLSLRRSVQAWLSSPAFDEMGRDLPDALVERAFDRMIRAVGELHRAGVTVIPGSDSFLAGGGLIREMELFSAAGIPAAAILKLATIEARRLLGLAEQSPLQPGKQADFIIVEGNPAQDISALRQVKWVVKKGKVWDPLTLVNP